MERVDRIDAFARFGNHLVAYLEGTPSAVASRIDEAIEKSYQQNNWFTPVYSRKALEGIAQMLECEILTSWMMRYPLGKSSKKVACVMAGNIPLVGFHDMCCVLLAGHTFIGKLSSKDAELLPVLTDILCEINPEFQKQILFVNSLQGVDYDAVIATGSSNSARYFEQYFGGKPHIIRKGRSSIAILTGNETVQELEGLADDLFLYFGLGCRNVSKIYIPKGFDVRLLFPHFEKYAELHNHHKWMNNYDYNRSIMLVNQDNFYDTGFALFVENAPLLSPITVIHYEKYQSEDEISNIFHLFEDNLQCVVSKLRGQMFVPLGKAQYPRIDDYADGVDTMKFLTTL